MTRQAWIPARSPAGAPSRPTGSATSVQKGSPTDGMQQFTTCTPDQDQGVLTVLAPKPASATHCSPCGLIWLRNGTTARTRAHLVTTQLSPVKRCRGTAAGEGPSKPPLQIAAARKRLVTTHSDGCQNSCFRYAEGCTALVPILLFAMVHVRA